MKKRKSSKAISKAAKKLIRRGGSVLLLCFISSAAAQVDRRPAKLEPESEFDSVPFSSVIRESDPPSEDFFRRIQIGPTVGTSLGAGGEAEATLGASFRPFSAPFQFGTRPEDAEFKAGPFYLDVRSLSGSILWSDNIERSEIDERSDVIAIMRLHLTAMLQVTENVRLAISGFIVYLPFENEFGIAGAGADDFLARFDYGPLGRAQISYDLKLSDWEILFYDDFSLRYFRSSEGLTFEPFEFDEEDRAGRYVYRQRTIDRGDFGDRNRRGLDDVFVGARNVVGVSATTVLPTVTRFTVGANHQNYIYFDRPDNANLIEERDELYASLVSERETLRFKPYVTARTWRTDRIDDWRKEAHVGFFGPITENLRIRADAGYFWGAAREDSDSLLWLVQLAHTPNDRMYHHLEYSKRISEFDEDLRESVAYHLRYRLSEDLRFEFFADRSQYEDIDSRIAIGGSEEWRAGARLTYDIAQRTTLRVGSVYTHVDRENPRSADTEKWTHRAELLYRYSGTLHARLIYQYEIRDSSIPLDSYNEHLVVLTITKYF